MIYWFSYFSYSGHFFILDQVEKMFLLNFLFLCIGGQPGFSNLNFIILKPSSLIMLHVKIEIHGCSD